MSETSAELTEEIRQRAYDLWEEAGEPEGRSDYFWHLAEREIKEHLKDYDKTLADTFPASDPPANSGITGPVEDAERKA